MLKRIMFVMLMVLVLSVALTACGPEPTPATLSNLPSFSGAKESTNAALKAAAAAVTDQLPKDSFASSESKAYDVPAGTTWAALKSAYGTPLEKDGWVVATASDNYEAWGSVSLSQAIYLVYVPAANGYVVVVAKLKK